MGQYLTKETTSFIPAEGLKDDIAALKDFMLKGEKNYDLNPFKKFFNIPEEEKIKALLFEIQSTKIVIFLIKGYYWKYDSEDQLFISINSQGMKIDEL
jgi:hypothetical protein